MNFNNENNEFGAFADEEIALENLRFNKCPTFHGEENAKNYDNNLYLNGVQKDVFPLVASEYNPLDPTKAIALKEKTLADSVVLGDDYQLREYRNTEIATYFEHDPITNAIIEPLYPGDGKDFWDQLRGVVKAQLLRYDGIANKTVITRAGSDKASMLNRWPELWYDRSTSMLNPWGENMPDKNLTLALVAKSVAGEFSNYHQQTLLKHFASQNVQLAKDVGLTERSKRDFIGMAVRMGAINAWSLEAVGPVNFYLKWNYGVPRPEEVAWKISRDPEKARAENVPHDLIEAIKSMNLEKATDFTAYDEGSPTHPSFPAMHSAGSTCSLWIPAIYNLSAEQYLETLRMDYGVAYARTIAGVHYDQDNRAGLNAGQRIIREKFPDFLSKNYGCDDLLVERKVKLLSFDWNQVEITATKFWITTPNGEKMEHSAFLDRAKILMSRILPRKRFVNEQQMEAKMVA